MGVAARWRTRHPGSGSRRTARPWRGRSACGDAPIITNPHSPRDRGVAYERGTPDNRVQLPR